MEGTELVAFQIIASVGSARSCYIEAIQEAKKGNFAGAEELMVQGDQDFAAGHHAHGRRPVPHRHGLLLRQPPLPRLEAPAAEIRQINIIQKRAACSDDMRLFRYHKADYAFPSASR